MLALLQRVPEPMAGARVDIDRKAQPVARVAREKSCVQNTVVFTRISDIEDTIVTFQVGLAALMKVRESLCHAVANRNHPAPNGSDSLQIFFALRHGSRHGIELLKLGFQKLRVPLKTSLGALSLCNRPAEILQSGLPQLLQIG